MKRLSLLLSLIGSLLTTTTVVNAQQADSTTMERRAHSLSEVNVVGPYRATQETPVSFKNVPLSVINRQNVGQEPAFILSNNSPSITVNSDAGSYSGYVYYRIRGIDQTRVNVTLNGVPLNEPEDQGAYFNNFPDFLNSVNSLQIQRGVGTSTNGVASYAGSLNFESVSLMRKRTEVGIGGGSYGSHRQYAEYNSGLQGKQAFYVRASNIHSDGYKDRSRHDGQSVFYSYGYFAKRSVFKLTGFVGLQRNLQSYLGAPLDSIAKNPRFNSNAYEPDKFLQSHTQGQHSYALGENSTLTTSVYYNYLRGNYDFDLNNFLGLPLTQELYNYAFRSHTLGVSSVYSLRVDKLKFDAGVHANRYQRQHNGSERTQGYLYTNTGFKNETSAFAKATYTTGKLSVFADAQVRHADFRYEGQVALPNQEWNFLNPRAGASFQAKDATFYYSVGRTSREPTRNDIFQGADDLPADESGNAIYAKLPAESVIDQELGVKLNYEWGHVKTNAYYMDFSNEIVLSGKVGPNGLPLRSNAAQSYRAGLEFDAEYNVGKEFSLVNNSSVSRNRITEGANSIQPVLTPSVIINQEVRKRFGHVYVGVNGRYQSSSYIDYANAARLPSFTILGASAAYEYKGFELAVKLNNLTNRQYYTSGLIGIDGRTYYNIQAPLNYFATLRYAF